MATKKKMLQAAAGSAGGAGAAALNVEDVFSTYLYEGNGSSQVIENGINLGQSNSGGSVYFDGYGTGLTISPSSGLGSGDFTVEFFVYPIENDNENYPGIFDCRASASDASGFGLHFDGARSGLNLRVGSVNNVVPYSTAPEGQWTHLAIVRSGTSLKLYANGTSVISITNSANFSRTTWLLGKVFDDYNFYGRISNARIVGSAVYTSDFTAPTAALASIGNTELLTCQGDDPFADNSSNGYTITKNGTPTAATFGPFDAAEAGEGGMVWFKAREIGNYPPVIFDTNRGVTKYLRTSEAFGEQTSSGITAFNSDGFDIAGSFTTGSATPYVSWTFRKAPKFFTCLTYSGTGSAQNISHDLGSAPGMVIVKRTDASYNWECWHSGLTDMTKYIRLNSTEAERDEDDFSLNLWNQTAPTDTSFTVGTWAGVNASGGTYVAYLFASNDGDGEFGPDGDADIIKCGSYTGTGAAGNFIDLGFEPQWVLYKRSDSTGSWVMQDNMRGMSHSGYDLLYANSSGAEISGTAAAGAKADPNGFIIDLTGGDHNASGGNYIYIAIRRGPLAPPESATEVFAVDDRTGASGNLGAYRSGFLVDMAFHKVVTSSINTYEIGSRLTQGKSMNTPDTSAEVSQPDQQYDYMDGWNSETSASSSKYSWMWRRAPGYFDVVTYRGNSTAGRTVSHNLGVAPEMMWVKARNNTTEWIAFHKDAGIGFVNSTSAFSSGSSISNPTDTTFSVAQFNSVNGSSYDYIAYLFASLDGISKVGSYTGTGATLNIDCGFTSGARFVLIKRTDNQSPWWVWDSERGIIAGNDPWLELNSTAAEVTNTDYIDPYSAGFTLTSDGNWLYGMNYPSGEYIFYAIA